MASKLMTVTLSAALMTVIAGCTAAAQTPASPSAPKPANTTLQISSPTSNALVQAGAVKVSIDYSGPTLVPGAEAKKLDDYHLHYFLDVDPGQYVNALKPIPTGDPHIVHSAAKEVTFDNVAAGSHTVWVVMSGNNHIPVSPTVMASVTFSAQ